MRSIPATQPYIGPIVPPEGHCAAQPVVSAVVWFPEESFKMEPRWSMQNVFVPVPPGVTGAATAANVVLAVVMVGLAFGA